MLFPRRLFCHHSITDRHWFYFSFLFFNWMDGVRDHLESCIYSLFPQDQNSKLDSFGWMDGWTDGFLKKLIFKYFPQLQHSSGTSPLRRWAESWVILRSFSVWVVMEFLLWASAREEPCSLPRNCAGTCLLNGFIIALCAHWDPPCLFVWISLNAESHDLKPPFAGQ